MPADVPFISYARNREDVVLWRALGDVPNGRYVEVGTTSLVDSRTRAFDERGWDRTAVEAVGDGEVENHVHLMLVSADSLEEGALESIDLRALRPWVLVIGSREAPQTRTSWEPGVLAAGYELRLFDGVSRFYVAHEQAARLGTALSYPACTRDDFIDASMKSMKDANDELVREVSRWRGLALTAWATWEPRTVSEWSIHDERERDSLRVELERIQQTLSWRITRPLRALRGVTRR